MKISKIVLLVALCVCTSCAFSQNVVNSTTSVRQKININREWKFELGDYADAKSIAYNDKSWKNVNLPHNFSIPYFQTAQWYTGYGWYRKYFDVPATWKSKRVFIEFEAAFREAQIFINGEQVGEHKGGYTGFTFDITDKLKTGRNVLAVRLNNNYNRALAPRNGDHNFTGGIYRDVYLVVTDPVHVTWYGSYVTTPKVSKAAGTVNVKTEIKNDGKAGKSYTVKTDIIDPAGKTVSTVTSTQRIGANELVNVDQTTKAIAKPKLWHPDHPYLYKAITQIIDGKKVLDRYETKFGFRWMKWTADSGFFLNGKHYYFRGANVHQDHAGWANAVTNAAIKRDVKMVKDVGMDFIRGSHYPHDPAFSEACDSLGVLLWEENDFWGSGGTQRETDNWYDGGGAYPMNAEDQAPFEASVKSDLREMIRIHRNHPAIIVWSMCNEPFFTNRNTLPKVREFLKELTKIAHELDPSRMVGIGGSQRGEIDKLGDIAGYNGDGARLFMNPGVPSVVTEYGSTIAIRPGKYEPGWGDLQKEKFAWRSGEALWCAFDYGTRAGDFGKMGMVDYFRLPKNQYYWYRNEYMHIPPPPDAVEGTAAKLVITSNKNSINGTSGTDDVMLIVAVNDKNGRQLSNSPDVTLQITSGPGEFPTGKSITFSNKSDIFIRDGKAAIEFRSYYGGKTVIKASSSGLQSSFITIETKGQPYYKKGVSIETQDRPYTKYVAPKAEPVKATAVNIAYQKPTRASSEATGKTANLVNDNNADTFWQSAGNGTEKWWQLDMENLYKLDEVLLTFPTNDVGAYRVEISKDGQAWQPAADAVAASNNSRKRTLQTKNSIIGRYLRIIFINTNGAVALSEVEVHGKTSN